MKKIKSFIIIKCIILTNHSNSKIQKNWNCPMLKKKKEKKKVLGFSEE